MGEVQCITYRMEKNHLGFLLPLSFWLIKAMTSSRRRRDMLREGRSLKMTDLIDAFRLKVQSDLE